MKKIKLFSILMLGFLSLSVNSCVDKVNDPAIIELSEAESLKILESPELQSFQKNREKFIQSVANAINLKGYSENELELLTINAFESGNEDLLLEILFDSKENGLAYLEELSQSREHLFAQYPILNRIREQEGYSNFTAEANAKMFYGNFDELSKINLTIDRRNRPEASLAGEEPVCGSAWNQVKVAVCASACSFASGGLAIALCGWGCWCTFCPRNSELSSAICAD